MDGSFPRTGSPNRPPPRNPHAPGRRSLPPGEAGLRERLTTLTPRSEVRLPGSVPVRTVPGPPDDGSRRQRRPRDARNLTPLAAGRSRPAEPGSASRGAHRRGSRAGRGGRLPAVKTDSIWEIVFLMVILKIPIVYLCVVVYYAIKAEPRPEAGASVTAQLGPEGPPDTGPRRRLGPRRI